MADYTHFTPDARERFIAKLADGASVAAAAREVGVSRRNVYFVRDADPEFAAAWDEAIETGTDILEDAAFDRAKATSDTLMIFLLKARRREKFGDKIQQEHTGKDGGPINVVSEPVDRARQLLGSLAAGKAGGHVGTPGVDPDRKA